MALKKKLFPRKGKEKDDLISKAKSHIHRLNLINKNYSRRAEISRKNAKIALKRGEKDRAKNFLIQYKSYNAKVDRTNNIRAKIERQIGAIEEGQIISQTGDIFSGIRDELEYIATKASPAKVAESGISTAANSVFFSTMTCSESDRVDSKSITITATLITIIAGNKNLHRFLFFMCISFRLKQDAKIIFYQMHYNQKARQFAGL